MDIYSKKGTKIRFIGCDESQHRYGSHTGDYLKLEIGGVYTVKETDVRSSHTKVYLEEWGGSFNSVCFEQI